MAFVVLDDQSGRVEVSVFGDTYAEHHQKLTKIATLVWLNLTKILIVIGILLSG
jgi:DNA polymerase III alpha subunit